MSAAATGSPVTPLLAARAWLDRAERLADAGLHPWTFRVAGTTIRGRSSDARLAERYRTRLAVPDPDPGATPDLHFDLLETDRLGWPSPAATVDPAHDPAQTTRRFADAGLSALLPPPEDHDRAYPWAVFSPATGRGLLLVDDARRLPPWTDGAPFAPLLHLAFAWRGWRFMHAAALGHGPVGALLAGAGGAGKSATTLAGVAHGLTTVGDDYLLVAPGEPPVAWPVYRIAKQDRAGLIRLGREDLAGRPENWNGKVELDLDAEFPGRLAESLTLRHILLPEVTGAARTTLTPLTPTAAFSMIAPSMLTQLPGARMAGFHFLTRLTRTLPAHRMRLSTDPGEIAAAVRERLGS